MSRRAAVGAHQTPVDACCQVVEHRPRLRERRFAADSASSASEKPTTAHRGLRLASNGEGRKGHQGGELRRSEQLSKRLQRMVWGSSDCSGEHSQRLVRRGSLLPGASR
ncbi:hypothetical protein PsYK624_138600 [Phanerochaete sordida]|uniref:Uncharacterized protein n=1 Tax=Phanerochaete sordida TaxID=48140 RepID=A0A9P3GQK0_9APHY|nr:hypothetical protein PsYK624_138600 [Phanerochaete sordida]